MRGFGWIALVPVVLIASWIVSCERSADPEAEPRATTAAPPSTATPAAKSAPKPAPEQPRQKVELIERAMGTEVTLVAFTEPHVGETATRQALRAAFTELVRLEQLMSEWRADSEVSRINQQAGQAVAVSPETYDVIAKAVWAGRISEGTFDISFMPLNELWRFGDAAEARPRLPSPRAVKQKLSLVDYRRIQLDPAERRVRIEPNMELGLGGIAKGYAVDRAAAVLRRHGLTSFLVQAGGDLYGAGRKPDGSPWVSGVQDPRGPRGSYFAIIELTDRAFSTAGDYARAYVVDGKRYHHILDPRTGYPARACRSVTIWAEDALLADAIDDAVFILGPKRGLALVESLEGAGAVIVDADNRVWLSERVKSKVRLVAEPTAGP